MTARRLLVLVVGWLGASAGWAHAQAVPAPPSASSQPASLPAPASAPTVAPSSPPAEKPAPKEEAIEEVEARPAPHGAERFFSDEYPRIDRGLNLPLPTPVRKGAMVLVVDHRTYKPFIENTWHDYFGFDGGSLKIGLGLRFGILDFLDAGVYRLNSATERFDTYEFDARLRFLRQERHFVDVGVRGGLTWFSQEDADDALGGFAQLLLARRLFQRLTLGAGLLFHSDSTNGVKSSSDDDWSLATAVIVDVRILGWLAWNVELGINVAGYGTREKQDAAGEDLTAYPSLSSSVRFVTSRHTFALVVTNNPYTSADGVVCNSPRGFDELVVGFTITREWNFW